MLPLQIMRALLPMRLLYHEARKSEALNRGHAVSFIGRLSPEELQLARDAYRAARRSITGRVTR